MVFTDSPLKGFFKNDGADEVAGGMLEDHYGQVAVGDEDCFGCPWAYFVIVKVHWKACCATDVAKVRARLASDSCRGSRRRGFDKR